MPSAGEVEQFAYCAHNWWLARQGHDEQDTSRHAQKEIQRIGQAFHEAARHRKTAFEGLQWSFRVLGVAAAAALVTIAFVLFDSTPMGFALVASALVVLNCAAGLLTIALFAEKKAKEIQAEVGLAAEPLPDSPVLHDEDWGVSGRLDYVLEAGSKIIPILVKTGRTPRKAHANHRLHVAVQLRLLDSAGRNVEYGLVTYPDGVFRVEWDEEAKAALQSTLERMRIARAAGKADRDHEQPGRCRGCARRAACTQRLA